MRSADARCGASALPFSNPLQQQLTRGVMVACARYCGQRASGCCGVACAPALTPSRGAAIGGGDTAAAAASLVPATAMFDTWREMTSVALLPECLAQATANALLALESLELTLRLAMARDASGDAATEGDSAACSAEAFGAPESATEEHVAEAVRACVRRRQPSRCLTLRACRHWTRR